MSKNWALIASELVALPTAKPIIPDWECKSATLTFYTQAQNENIYRIFPQISLTG
ncbi:hypothetical protein [Dyadobacter flavalbus]|uniref:hypothetical protein n=1 Tax=Dyadobacter flavalbus TaxID=2579942 RepID=UPI0013763DBE|nr:hypothetical protein [Dyadobacter flavalbus]